MKILDGYKASGHANIGVGKVRNITGEVYDINIEEEFSLALQGKLAEYIQASTTGSCDGLTIDINIIEYRKGSAFDRWLAPGAKDVATFLAVDGSVVNSEGVVIGLIQSNKTIDFGGAFTVNAWSYIFNQVAESIVKELVSSLIKKNHASQLTMREVSCGIQ